MKQIHVFLLFLLALSACSEHSKLKDEESEQTVVVDTLENTIDSISTSGLFIQDFEKHQFSTNKKSKSYFFEAKIILENKDFSIIQFTEKMGDDNFDYVICLNSEIKHVNNSDVHDHFLNIEDYLLKLKIPFQFLIGTLVSIEDINSDGKEDFLLTNNSSFRTSMSDNATLLSYNGDKKLSPQQIQSNSDYTGGECEKLIGFKELISFSPKSPYQLTIEREENSINPDGCEANYLLNYQKKYKSENGEWELQPCIHTPLLDKDKSFQKLPKVFTLLSLQNGAFVVQENCQNGGASTYELKAYKPNEDCKYYLRINFDNVETFFLAGFEKKNENLWLLHWRPLGDADSKNKFTDIETNALIQTEKIEKDPLNEGIYFINGSSFTTNPDKYPLISCDFEP